MVDYLGSIFQWCDHSYGSYRAMTTTTTTNTSTNCKSNKFHIDQIINEHKLSEKSRLKNCVA